ncbi:helix-turn-helix domain-containing protein [Microvirga sp. BSC39]|uniref:helix-turn-helix domain-containing protein n=1 Tax=Microvirga sp. BSC39 TaxID=1549810 RepID=UPI0004E9584F|nr:helix-turn-helix domain-containing protein [Microvirga sp. BSC39]KFG71044.1 hypothetical protein JH26_00415 [Microvirga sp. BSC39]
MADGDLSASAKCVAAVLLCKFFNNGTGKCTPSYQAIADNAGRTRRAVVSSIAELQAKGWITFESTLGGSPSNTNKFRFAFEGLYLTGKKNNDWRWARQDGGVKSASPVKSTAQRVKRTAHEPLKNPPPSSKEGGGG